MNTKKDEIIKEWNKTKVVHPSYGEIAKKVEVSKNYVWQIINAYKKENDIK